MKFTANESTPDRLIRIVAGIALGALALTGTIGGAIATVALVAAAIALVTGVVGFCPLYAVFRVGTKSNAR